MTPASLCEQWRVPEKRPAEASAHPSPCGRMEGFGPGSWEPSSPLDCRACVTHRGRKSFHLVGGGGACACFWRALLILTRPPVAGKQASNDPVTKCQTHTSATSEPAVTPQLTGGSRTYTGARLCAA